MLFHNVGKNLDIIVLIWLSLNLSFSFCNLNTLSQEEHSVSRITTLYFSIHYFAIGRVDCLRTHLTWVSTHVNCVKHML